MKLVPNWQHLWKSYSVQAIAAAVAIIAAWNLMPDSLVGGVSQWVRDTVVIIVLVLAGTGRFLAQNNIPATPKEAVADVQAVITEVVAEVKK